MAVTEEHLALRGAIVREKADTGVNKARICFELRLGEKTNGALTSGISSRNFSLVFATRILERS